MKMGSGIEMGDYREILLFLVLSRLEDHLSADHRTCRFQRLQAQMSLDRDLRPERHFGKGLSVTENPAATKQEMENPLQLVYNTDEKLQLNPEALKVLQSIEDPLVVVAMVGAARTGKSYLMNCLAGNKNGFSVDSSVQAHTKGIWMWCQSLPQRPKEVLLLLDTEGLGDPEKGNVDNDQYIYSLAILLSSTLIYNGQRNIDQQSLQDLHFVTELSKRIQMKSQPDGCNSWDFIRFFPEFVWVIRDMTLKLKIDKKPVTANEYLEHNLKLKDSEKREQDKKFNELRRCIRNHFPSRCCFAFPIPTINDVEQLQELEDKDLNKDFVKERQNLIDYIHTRTKVKRVLGGQLVTGRRFAELTKEYVDMMADGVLPCVESSVTKLVEVENQAAADEALKFFNTEIEKFSESGCFTMSNLIKYYNEKSIEAFSIFQKRCMNDDSGKHIEQLQEKMSSTYKTLMVDMKKKSQKECEEHLETVMSSIKQKLTSGFYQKPGGFQDLKKDLDEAIKEYEEKTKNQMEGCAVLTRFLEEEQHHLDHVQKMDNMLTEAQMRISAVKENLANLKQAMQKMEQEEKAAEERRNKQIFEQIRKRFEEGKKCSMEELKEAMEHMRSEMKKYEVEGRKEDAERAQQMYEYLEKKYEEASQPSFMNFIRRLLRFFQFW